MKKMQKLLCLLLLLVLPLSVFAACGSAEDAGTGDPTVTVQEVTLLQTVYPRGVNLNLTGGFLTVTEDGETKQIPLNAKGVSYAGYQKNYVGDHDVTFTYRGKTAIASVTVVERLAVFDCLTTYYVGDDFNKAAGRLKFTRDDGSAYIVLISDESVTVSDFDSTTPGVKTLTVTLKTENGTYTAPLTVTVHAALA